MDFNHYKKIIDELALSDKETKTLLQEGLLDLKNRYPMLDRFAVRGYTPSFNDGDACTFSLEIFINNLDELDILEDDEDDEEEVEVIDYNADMSRNDARACDAFITKYLSTLIEKKYVDDFQIVFTYTSTGEVSIDVEDYDCGY